MLQNDYRRHSVMPRTMYCVGTSGMSELLAFDVESCKTWVPIGSKTTFNIFNGKWSVSSSMIRRQLTGWNELAEVLLFDARTVVYVYVMPSKE
ncbi:hypothetical protein RJT34_17218 [Clitoria ternatea]|uniref:Uncharacterized protein n=1 Tax=Clitoria ternatea TaxID=43366 RepID=A0AAN9J9T6_CLITE